MIKNAWRRARRKLANLAPVRWAWSNRYLLILRIDAGDAPAPGPDDGLACNDLSQLAYFRQTERWLTPASFADEARRRVAEGMLLYTAVRDRVLVHYGWLVPRQDEARFTYVSQSYRFPPGSSVLFNAYTCPAARGGGLHERSMRRRVADAAALPGTRYVYTAIESHNKVSRAVAERVGFRCVDVLYERIRFGRRTQGCMTPSEFRQAVEGTGK
jgi:L-amino acid N-acyltransferase YncA